MKRLFLIISGFFLFLICYFYLPKDIFSFASERAAIGTVVWMAFWWITGSVDFAVTAFLPIVLNAIFQMADMSNVLANYASETIILLLGASMLTVSWEKIGLDQRIAVKFLSMIGSQLRNQIVFWFLFCTVLSAILPNAVVCASITPIAVSMLHYIGEDDIANSRVGSLLLLTIAYATGIGGLATPLGGAMNLVTIDYLEQITGQEYMYISWVIRFFPIMVVLVVSNIALLLIGCKKGEEIGGSKEYFVQRYKELPKISLEEKVSLTLFLIATILSFFRPFYQNFIPGLKPAYIFIICAMFSFFITSKDGNRLIKWNEAQKKIGWELIYVFAGGLAVGTLINQSGAAESIGNAIKNANLSEGYITILCIITFSVILSDITSNTATAAIIIPIVIGIMQGKGINPVPYIYLASIGINMSYMLPTSIRAIPVGYGMEPRYMLKKGIPITIVEVLVMSVLGYVLLNYWTMFSTV